MNTEDKPRFQPGDMVETPIGEHQRVIACDLHGCTVDNGTPGGARYAPEVLVRVKLPAPVLAAASRIAMKRRERVLVFANPKSPYGYETRSIGENPVAVFGSDGVRVS